ncbi:MAG TPA: Rid family detoxifying hydrolase [Roseiflexaceae bacterium]|nr:Rid family detoxifying hydrolase [Roseiflexaceae bacterium]
MPRDPIVIPNAPPPSLPYSPGIRSGDHVFLSGQTGVAPATGRLAEGGVAAQAEQIFKNLARVLEAAGLGFGDVVKCNVYLTDIGDFQAMNGVYARQFEQPYPARTTVAVAALPGGAQIEIELVARQPA